MNENINLKYVEGKKLGPEARAMFNVLKATLEYPATAQQKGVKIADDIDFFARTFPKHVDLWTVWFIVLDIAACLPPDHSWQDSLVKGLEDLGQRDICAPGYEHCTNDSGHWKNLPNFAFAVREKWDSVTDEDFSNQRNMKSFIARFVATQPVIWLTFPVWQLRETLEKERPFSKPARECELWIACEWMIQCAGPLLKELTSDDELSEDDARCFATGTLLDCEKPLSIERWRFWEKRFSEVVAQGGYGSDVSQHVSDALSAMKAAEE